MGGALNTTVACGFRGAVCLFLLSLASAASATPGLEPLDQSEMAGISAREGIALDLQFGINMEPNPDFDPGLDPGDPGYEPEFQVSSGLGTCLGNVECRLALEFEGRANKWLVLKDYFGYLKHDNLLLDAANLPGGSSPHQDSEPFQDEAGNCILAGCDPNGLPALQVTYPDAQPADQDLSMFMNIGRVAVEFGAQGYLEEDAQGSVLGFRTANTSGGPATADIDGRMLVYGF